MLTRYSIAIDGPSGAGKSTVAKKLSEKLDILYLDTGAMYRAIGYFIRQKNIDPRDGLAVAQVLPEVSLSMQPGRVVLNGQDISSAIRTPEISSYASLVSALPAVRERMWHMQREIAEGQNIVLDGRDIGTHVLPDAPYKFFITASENERARRRYEELCAKGENVTFAGVLADMHQRDLQDSTRALAPLAKADDAIEIITDNMTADEVVLHMLAIMEQKGSQEE